MSEELKWVTVQFDSQVLSAFMGCPREMDFRFNQHLVPIIGVSKSIEKGTLVHHGLNIYYDLMGKGESSEIRKLAAIKGIREYAPTLEALEGEDVVDVLRAFEEYHEYRKNDVFHVAFTEKVFKKIVYEVYPLRIVLTGRIDMGVLDLQTQSLIPWDHKSESESWFHSSLRNQFKIYAIACDSQRLIVNRFGFQKTVKADKKFKREDINFESDVLEEFKNEVIPYYAKQMLIANEDNYYPPNYSNCIKGHFACIFSDKHTGGVCNISRGVREDKLKRYFTVKEWNMEMD